MKLGRFVHHTTLGRTRVSSSVDARLGIALSALVSFSAVGQCAHALPLETFQSPLSITCEEGQRFCAGVLRSDDSLGKYTGVVISKPNSGEVTLKVSTSAKRRLVLEAEDVSEFSLTLSWDGDSNPEQLSGAGLNCADLTRNQASAFIVPDVEVDAECVESLIDTDCPSFGVEARVYNPADPTGQKFSVSRGRRHLTKPEDVVVPFSNFLGQGPRGSATFSCVGAVTLRFTFRDISELEFSLGPVYSNGVEGQTPLPTSTAAPVETATIAPASTVTPVLSATESPRAPQAAAGAETLPEQTARTELAPATEQPVVTATLMPAGEDVLTPVAPTAIPSEASLAAGKDEALKKKDVVRQEPKDAEEVVYGELVTGQ
jgi:hypothetical protein